MNCPKCASKKLYITETFTQCDSCQHKWGEFMPHYDLQIQRFYIPASGRKLKVNWRSEVSPDIIDLTPDSFYDEMVEQVRKSMEATIEYIEENSTTCAKASYGESPLAKIIPIFRRMQAIQDCFVSDTCPYSSTDRT